MNKRVIISPHARARIEGRLSELVTLDEVTNAAMHVEGGRGRYWELKKVNYRELPDPDVRPDGVARGNQIVLVVDRITGGIEIQTVLLRKAWERAAEYHKIFKIRKAVV
jgi:hypothetical protein